MNQHNDFPFFESIRLQDGAFCLLAMHQHRMEETLENHQINQPVFDLKTYLHSFTFPEKGLFKCRLDYGKTLAMPEFIPYRPKLIRTLKCIDCDDVSYNFKYNNREQIAACFAKRGQADDVVILRNGLITDTSYCNIVFFDGKEWITPESPLLKGVQRTFLLNQACIKSGRLHRDDIKNFQKFRLFNAMIPWEEAIELPVSAILD